LDAKRSLTANCSIRLTLRELELTTSSGLTGLLTLYDTVVASHEAGCTQRSLVVRIDLDESTSDTETRGLALTGGATAIDVDIDVVAILYTEESQRLLHDADEERIGEELLQSLLIDRDVPAALLEIDTGDRCLSSAECIDYFHAMLFLLLQVGEFDLTGLLSSLIVLLTSIDVEVIDQRLAEAILGQHPCYHATDEAVCTTLLKLSLGRGESLSSGEASIAYIDAIGPLLAGHDGLVSIDDNDVVTAVYVRCEGRLVLPSQQLGDLTAESSDGLTGGVYEKPLSLDSCLICRNGLIT